MTDAVLLDLAINNPREIAIRKFTKHEEGKTTGADWEWWFGDQTAWFGMRVQAKVLDTASLRYATLGHRVKGSRKLQVNLLLEDARKRALYPMYCFYNFWDVTAVNPPWNCQSIAPRHHQFGCTIADARPVKKLIAENRDGLMSVAPSAFPWTCLVCCTGGDPRPTDGFAGRVRAFVAWALSPRTLRRSIPKLVAEPPAYVRAMFARDRREVRGLPEMIDGVMAVRDTDSRSRLQEPEPKPRRRARPVLDG